MQVNPKKQAGIYFGMSASFFILMGLLYLVHYIEVSTSSVSYTNKVMYKLWSVIALTFAVAVAEFIVGIKWAYIAKNNQKKTLWLDAPISKYYFQKRILLFGILLFGVIIYFMVIYLT